MVTARFEVKERQKQPYSAACAPKGLADLHELAAADIETSYIRRNQAAQRINRDA